MSTVRTASRFTWALGLMPLAPGQRVLEVGCGHGLALGLVASRVHPGCVLGIDRSPKMIAQAARRNADAVRAGHVVLRTGTLASVDLGTEPFELAFAINVSLFARDAHVVLPGPARDADSDLEDRRGRTTWRAGRAFAECQTEWIACSACRTSACLPKRSTRTSWTPSRRMTTSPAHRVGRCRPARWRHTSWAVPSPWGA
ncbi:class I SAM-dependent methyltransferase [Corallococcus soli]